MGVVYKAEDTKLGRLVALKFLPDELSCDKHALERFQREARAASALNHPNICTIHDIDEASGRHFIAMELLEGQTLREKIAGSPLPAGEVIELGIQITEALEAAHKKGIIHRDIKPANIFVSERGQAKILDFGLAKLAQERAATAAASESATADVPGHQLTGSGAAVGTVAYMSPEQLLGGALDVRADIWAIGCVLYEMVAGRGPFPEAPSPRTIAAILQQPPELPSAFNAQVPAPLERIILKCLDKRAGRRYQSAAELAADLHRLSPRGGRAPTARWPVRLRWHRRVVLGGVAATMALIVVVLGIYYRAGRPLSVERGWVLVCDFDNTAGNDIPDEALREGLTIDLKQSRYVNVIARARVYDVLQRMKRPGVQRVDARLGREICQRENVDVLIAAAIARIGDVFQITVQGINPARGDVLFAEKARFRSKEDSFVQIDDLARRVRGDLGESLSLINTSSRPLAKVTTPSLQALQLYSQAADAFAQGKVDEAPGLLQNALGLDPDFAMAHRMLGGCYSWMVGRNERATAELQLAYDLRAGVTDRERLWIEAEYYIIQGRSEQAEQALKALVALHPDDPDAHYQLALAYYTLARLPQAIDEIGESLRLNPNFAPAYGKAVVFLARTNQHVEATRMYEKAAGLGLHSPYLHWGLGLTYLGLRRLDDARKEFTELDRESPTDRELGQLYLAVTDLDEGKMASATGRLSSPLMASAGSRAWLTSRYLLGRIALMQGNRMEAARHADSILTRPEGDLLSVDVLRAGLLYADSGGIPQAARVLRRLEAIRGRNPSGWNNRCVAELDGAIALAGGDAPRAIDSFQQAATAFPDLALHRVLALAYQRQQRWDLAVREWELFLAARGAVLQNEFPPDLVLARLHMARLFARRGDAGAAGQNYRNVLQSWEHADPLSQRREAEQELGQLTGPRTM